MRLITLATLFLVTAVCSAIAANSSFQRSCSNIDLDLQNDNAWIVADCGDDTGRDKPAEIAIRGIHNDHGQLVQGSGFSSSFQRSCRSASLQWNKQSVTLYATCGDGNGGEKNSAVDILNIHNRFGVLTYN